VSKGTKVVRHFDPRGSIIRNINRGKEEKNNNFVH